MVDDLQFLRIVADVGTLADLLCGAGDGNLDLHRIMEQGDGQFADLRRHRGREHHTLAILRKFIDDLHDIVDEAHVEHAVSLVEHEEGTAGEV